MIKAFALTIFEKIINAALSLNPDCLQPLQAFAGNVVELTIKPFANSIFIHIKKDGFWLGTESTEKITTKISGNVLVLIKQGSSRETSFDGLKMEGDVELARALSDVLKLYPIHRDEVVSYLLGDVWSHGLKQQINKFFAFEKRTRLSLQTMFKEYSQEEIKSSPCREEVEDAYEAIYELQNDVDRFALRIQRLSQQLLDRAK